MALATGRLRNRVTIRRKTRTKKPGGGFEVSWDDVDTVWAEVIGLAGREATIGEALQGITAYRITVRFGVDVNPADQLGYGDLDLNVRSVNDPDGRREALLILADTGSAEAAG